MTHVKSTVNPKNKEDLFKEIVKNSGALDISEFDKNVIEQIEKDYNDIINPSDKTEEIPSVWGAVKGHFSNLFETSQRKADLRRLEKQKKFIESKNIPPGQLPLGLEEQLFYEEEIRGRNKKIAGTLLATGALVTAAFHLWPEPQQTIAAEPLVKTTYLHNISGDAQVVEPDLNTPVSFNTSAEKLLSMPDLNDNNRTLLNWIYQYGGGVDQDIAVPDFDSLGNVEIPFKATKANVSGIIKMDYQEALRNLPSLLDGVDQIEINTEGYYKAGTGSVYRNIDGSELVNKTMQTLGITDRDPTKYTMNITSQIDAINKTAKHVVKFDAKDDSVESFDSGALNVEKMAEVLDINNDNIGGDDYRGFLNQLQIWQGINYGVSEALQPTIDTYTTMIADLNARLYNRTAERDQNNSALNNLTAHWLNILNNVSELGYIGDLSDYTSVEEAVSDIVEKAKDLLEMEFSIGDKRVMRYVYDNIPEDYKQYVADSEEDLNTLLDGITDNGEFERYNLSISGKITENADNITVNVTGNSLLDATGTEHDYSATGIPREAVTEILYQALKAQGVVSTQPIKRIIDKNTAEMLYHDLGTIDQKNSDLGTPTYFQKQFMSESDYTRLFNNNNSDEELKNITLNTYQSQDAQIVEVVYGIVREDGTTADVPSVKTKEWLAAVYEAMGD